MASTKDLSNDERFSRVSKDPRFWEMPEKDKKIKIDKRFRAMFDDNKFNLKYTVDKRGRPMNHSTVQDMKRFYDLAESDESDSAEAPHSEKSQKEKKKKKKTISDSTELSISSHLNEEGTNKDKVEFLECSDSQEVPKSFTVTHSVGKPNLKMDRVEKLDYKETSVAKSQTKGVHKLAQKKEKQQNIISFSSADRSKKRTEKSADAINNKAKKCTEETKMESESNEAAEQESSDESESEVQSLDLGERHEENDAGLEDEDSVVQTSEEDNSDSEEEEDEEESDSGPDLARGKGNVETSSEDEQDDDMVEIFPKEPEIDHAWGELDRTAHQTDELTRRLAVCNMDWDHLKAKDLLALFNSFKPKGGVIFSVKIYPSEYGKERMKKESVHGPIELKELPEDATDEQKIYREKLREYQFKRLKYFYAVVECDSSETANRLYEECDGLEYESSCSFVDLRFIPDSVTFDDEAKDIATDCNFSAYTPKYFTTPAMTTAKIEITWDENDNDRLSSLNRTFKKDEILDMDFQAYLASSSEDEVEEEEEEQENHQQQQDKPGEYSTKSKRDHKDDDEQIAKYRELLKNIQDKDKKHEENDMEMEVTWVPGFKQSAEQMVKNKLEGKDSLTPWERFLQKKKDKRKLKKKKKDDKKDTSREDEVPPDVDLSDPFFAEEFAEPAGLKKKSKKADIKREVSDNESDVERQKAEIALLMMEDDEDDRKHFNYEKIVEQQNLSKKKKKKLAKKQELLEDDFEINVADTRFQSMFTSHLYNVDPSHPHFKKTKAMKKVLEEKVRRREQEQIHHKDAIKKPEKETEDGRKQQNNVKTSIDPTLSILIKSVKNKTEQFQARKKQKVI